MPTVVLLLGLAAAGLGGSAAAADPELLVVVQAGVEAYEQAVEGLRAGMAEGPAPLGMSVVDLARKDAPALLSRQLNSPSLRAIVAVGPEALSVAAPGAGRIPLFSTLMLRSDIAQNFAQHTLARPATTLSLDIPLEAVLKELRRAFPGKSRIGILRNPLKRGPAEAWLQSTARAAGFTLEVVDCSRPDRLLQAFLSLKGRVDFVWCLPDSDLYNSATVRPLLMASLGNQLPVIGFSDSFVQAGAVLGVYPDFFLAGRQTAELVRKCLAGSPSPAHERLKTARASLNPRVARLLGLRPDPAYPAQSHLLNLAGTP